MRKPNYRQQKKTREDARKNRQAVKQERRQAPAKEADDADAAQVHGELNNPAGTQTP